MRNGLYVSPRILKSKLRYKQTFPFVGHHMCCGVMTSGTSLSAYLSDHLFVYSGLFFLTQYLSRSSCRASRFLIPFCSDPAGEIFSKRLSWSLSCLRFHVLPCRHDLRGIEHSELGFALVHNNVSSYTNPHASPPGSLFSVIPRACCMCTQQPHCLSCSAVLSPIVSGPVFHPKLLK